MKMEILSFCIKMNIDCWNFKFIKLTMSLDFGICI